MSNFSSFSCKYLVAPPRVQAATSKIAAFACDVCGDASQNRKFGTSARWKASVSHRQGDVLTPPPAVPEPLETTPGHL